MISKTKSFLAALLATSVCGGAALADTISPESYSTALGVGESVTIQKTVVVEAAGVSSAVVDAFFLIDTSGSMGAEINAAKAATANIIAGLQAFGSAAAGVGVFSEQAELPPALTPPGSVLNQDVTTDTAAITTAVNAVTLHNPDSGGDFPESSNTAIDLVANNASWRPGSNRFIFVLGDASAKGVSDATVMASLAANNVNLVGVNFGGTYFANDITDIGGTVFDGDATADSIVSAVTAGLTAGFASYSTVSVGDLGLGDPEIDVSVTCTGADSGACNGATAEGDFDRSTDRSFTFDVTFTRTAEGDKAFSTYALVDGGVVATEADTITTTTAPVPLPAPAWMLLAGVGVLGALRRRA